MNGVLVLDKPAGFTSFDAVAVLRKLTGERKIGHTGTLDPMATGVLPLLLGRAAKAADLLPDTDKEYLADFRLGERYDTGDVTGTLLKKDRTAVMEKTLREALLSFLGEISQVPPMFSAVSVGGERLYRLARQGREIERPARKITVSRLELLSYDSVSREGRISVRCSKGTYIRTLLEDIAASLGTLGVMTALRRTAACGFHEEDALSLSVLREMKSGDIEAGLRSVESLFFCFPAVEVTPAQAVRFRNGGSLALSRLRGLPEKMPPRALVRVRARREGFLGLGEADLQSGMLTFRKLFYEEQV